MKAFAGFASRCLFLVLSVAGAAYGAEDEVVISPSETTISKTNFVGQLNIRKVTMPVTLGFEKPAEGFHFLQRAGTVADAGLVLGDTCRSVVSRAEYLYASYATHGPLASGMSYAYVTYLSLDKGETIEFSAHFDDVTTIAVGGGVLLNETTWDEKKVSFTADETRLYEVFVDCYIRDGVWTGSGFYGNVRFRLNGSGWQEFDAAKVPNRFYLSSDALADSVMSLKALFPDSYQNITNVALTGEAEALPSGFFAGCTALRDVVLPSTLVSLGLDDIWPGAPLETNGVFISYGDWIVGCTDSTLSSLEIPEGCVHIGTEAFSKMKNLSSATFPTTLRTIGNRAFAGDVRLTRIDIPAGVETVCESAFEDCTAVGEITFAEGVRSIRASAFENCALVRSLTLPESLRDLRTRAFADNWRMLSVSLPAGITNLAANVFAGCKGVTGVTVPTHVGTFSSLFPDAWTQIDAPAIAEGETSVADGFFGNCTQIGAISILPSVTNVGANAFAGCTGLTEIMLPTSVVAIGESSFSGCSSLAALKLSTGLVEIGAKAFTGCALASVVVPASVRRIGAGAFPAACSAAYFLGDAPSCAGDPYANAKAVSHVTNGSTDWDGVEDSTTLPETWMGHAIDFWSPNRLEVVFDACGGVFRLNGVSCASYAVEEITGTGYALPPLSPVDAGGRIFAGWWTERSGGAQVTGLTKVTSVSGHVLYAHWTSRSWIVTVRFNASGGTVDPEAGLYESGRPYGTLPVATRDGYSFSGWFTAAEGGTAADETSFAPAEDGELFARWTPVAYSVRYDANGGTGSMAAQTLTYGVAAPLADCAFSRTGHAFAGWSLSSGGDVDYQANETVLNLRKTQGDAITLYAVWVDVSGGYAVRFDANGGSGTMKNQTFSAGESKPLVRCAFACGGFLFAGWSLFPESEALYADGESVCDLAAKGASVTLYAQWTDIVTVSLDANGGTVSPETVFRRLNEAYGALPTPVCRGFDFAGWRDDEGRKIGADTVVPSRLAVRLVAEWERSDTVLFSDPYSPSAAPFAGNATYSGWICDADGNLTGLVTLKASKASARTAVSRLSATVKWADGSRSTALTGSAEAGSVSDVTLENRRGDSLTVTLARDSMAADESDVSLQGSSLPFGGVEGSYAVALSSDDESVLFSLSVGRKGRTRVTALLSSGRRLTATCQAVTGEDGRWCVPVAFCTSSLRVGFLAWFSGEDFVSVEGTSWTVEPAAFGPMTGPSGLAAFSVSDVGEILPDALEDFLPTNQLLTVDGRWATVDRAGQVKYDRALETFVATTDNPSALKLTYTAKTGLFTGSFKAYVANGTRLKTKTFKVNGFCVNGQGIGFATLNGRSVPVAVVGE